MPPVSCPLLPSSTIPSLGRVTDCHGEWALPWAYGTALPTAHRPSEDEVDASCNPLQANAKCKKRKSAAETAARLTNGLTPNGYGLYTIWVACGVCLYMHAPCHVLSTASLFRPPVPALPPQCELKVRATLACCQIRLRLLPDNGCASHDLEFKDRPPYP